MVLQERPVILGPHLMRGKPGQVQGAPEAVAAPSKVMALGCGEQARIDPAKNHCQPLGQDVFKSFIHTGHPAPGCPDDTEELAGLAQDHLVAGHQGRKVVPLDIDAIAAGRGGIHCVTSHQPLV